MSVSFSYGQGSKAEAIPSKNCYYAYDTRETVPAHEIGHCLGLFHTWEFEGQLTSYCTTENSPYYSGGILQDGSNCMTAGDMLCDTPADPEANTSCWDYNDNCSFDNPSSITDPVGNEYIDPNNVLLDNIMSYNWTCNNNFTDDQHHKIRDMLFDAAALEDIMDIYNETTITSTTTWASPRDFLGDVVVTSGSTLNIETTVKFAKGTGIILEPGSSLNLDGATLDLSEWNPCGTTSDDLWKGIKMERTSSNKPTIDIYQSTIKNAYKALYYDGSGPSFLFVSQTDFINNKISFENIGTTSGLNVITDCTFTIDGNYLLSDIDNQVEAINSTTTTIRGCAFSVTSTEPLSDTRAAISAYNSQMNVMGYSGNNTFNNWTEAVESYNGVETRPLLVRYSDFTNNHSSIVTDNTYLTTIYLNDINISDNFSTSSVYYGIKMENADDLDVYENEIYSNSSGYNRYGIYSDETGSNNLAIDNNTITNMTKGIFVENAGTASSGLTILCNDQTSNDQYDIHANNGIGPVHGSSGDPGGNIFSGVGGISDFYVQNTAYFPDYYYSTTAGNQNPVYSSGINEIPTGNSPACTPGVNLRNNIKTRSLDDFWDNNVELKNLIADKKAKKDKLNKNSPEYKGAGNEIYLLEVAKNRNINKAMIFILEQEEIDYDELRSWLTEKDSYQSDLSIVKTFVDQRNYDVALGEINSLINKRQLSKSERLDWNQHKSYLQLLINVYRDNRHEGMLDDVELKKIISIAYNAIPGPTRNEARTLLAYFYDYKFDQEYEDLTESFLRSTIRNSEELIVHPNPSAEILNIISKYDPIDIRIFSLDGRLIYQSRNNRRQVDVSGLESGLYIYQIDLENGEVSSGKFIKE